MLVGLLAAQVAITEAAARDSFDKMPSYSQKDRHSRRILSIGFSFSSTMFGVWFFLLSLQPSLFPTAQAASLILPSRNVPVTFPGTTNSTIAKHASISLSNPSNELSVFFANPGGPIPSAELRNTLSVATARVRDYLPHHANAPIAHDFFETNTSFPETGDSVSLSVYVYGHRLTWLQLSSVLMILQQYMLGMGPGHPDTHHQQLEFYVQLAAGVEVAHGVVGFSPGARAVVKRSLITTTLQLPHANVSSLQVLDPPIIFNIPKTNLDLNITSLGIPIPESNVLGTIEAAYTDVILNHTDIDSPMPANQPYSFNTTAGKWPRLSSTEIRISHYPGKRVSWGLLCLLMYGLRDFMRETEHFNAVSFEVNEGRIGRIAHGDVLYVPAAQTAAIGVLQME